LLLLMSIALVVGIQSYSQQTYPIRINIKKEKKVSEDFAKEDLKIRIETTVIEDLRFSNSFTLIGNNNKYYFYLFQAKAREVTTLNALYSWARNTDRHISATNTYNLYFDGYFIKYDGELLARTAWQSGGIIFNDRQLNIDSYTLIQADIDESARLIIEYVFLITDSKKKLIGVSTPVKYEIPEKILKQLLPSVKEEVEQSSDSADDQSPTAQDEHKQEYTEDPDPQALSPATRSETNICTQLNNRYNSIANSIKRLQSDVNRLINLRNDGIYDGILFLKRELAGCQNIACYDECKRRLDEQPWKNRLEEFKTTLNNIDNDNKNLRNEKEYAACVKLGDLTPGIANIGNIIENAENEIEDLKIEIERKLLAPEILDETIQKYQRDITAIVESFNTISNLYIGYDELFFDDGNLKKEQIKNLEKSITITDSLGMQIISVLTNAATYYKQKSGHTNFPEATFKNESGLEISRNDCNNLKADLTDLRDRVIVVSNGHLTEILITILALILLVGGYAYFNALVKRKVSTKEAGNKSPDGISSVENPISSELVQEGGIEILEDEEEINKGKGINTVRKLAGIKYFEVDVQSFIRDTKVRKVYFSKEFIVKAYRYFEDKMLNIGNGSIDDLYEYGGYIIGNWGISLYDDNQYDLSLEHFMEPGEDAKFSKFNIDFGYDISFRMEEMLIDNAKRGNEQVFVGWLHSHPGHNVFLSNYDIEVQERFRNQYHPNRHIALVLEPTTAKWDLGLFSFTQEGVMNNKEDVRSLLSFHSMYSWAIGEALPEIPDNHLIFKLKQTSGIEISSISFDKSLLLQLKIIIERKLTPDTEVEVASYLSGVVSHNTKSGSNIHLLSVMEEEDKLDNSLEVLGLFVVTQKGQIEDLRTRFGDLAKSKGLHLLLAFNKQNDTLIIIYINKDGQFVDEDDWITFPKSDILPFLSK